MPAAKLSADVDPSCRASSKGRPAASSSASACASCIPAGRCATACRTSAVFPMPASPSTHTTRGFPDPISSRRASDRFALSAPADQLTCRSRPFDRGHP